LKLKHLFNYFMDNFNIRLDVSHPKLGSNYRFPTCLCNDGQSIFIFGVHTYVRGLGKVYKYNTKTDEYIAVCEMPKISHLSSVARTPDNKIVIGFEGNRHTHKSEYLIYDENTNKWEKKALPNDFKIRSSPAITFDLNGNLHVIGGGYNSKKCHYVCEWNKQKWIKMNDLSFTIFGAGLCCGPDGLLYLFGGRINSNASNKMWIYNVNTTEWKQGPSMPHPRYVFGYIYTGNQIIVAGGYSNTEHNDIFVYDFKTQQWSISPKKLSNNMYGLTMTMTNNFEIHGFGGYTSNGCINDHFIMRPNNKVIKSAKHEAGII